MEAQVRNYTPRPSACEPALDAEILTYSWCHRDEWILHVGMLLWLSRARWLSCSQVYFPKQKQLPPHGPLLQCVWNTLHSRRWESVTLPLGSVAVVGGQLYDFRSWDLKSGCLEILLLGSSHHAMRKPKQPEVYMETNWGWAWSWEQARVCKSCEGAISDMNATDLNGAIQPATALNKNELFPPSAAHVNRFFWAK